MCVYGDHRRFCPSTVDLRRRSSELAHHPRCTATDISSRQEHFVAVTNLKTALFARSAIADCHGCQKAVSITPEQEDLYLLTLTKFEAVPIASANCVKPMRPRTALRLDCADFALRLRRTRQLAG